MQLGRVMAVLLRYGYLLRNSPARVLSLYVWVAVNLVIWGLFTRFLAQEGGLRFHAVTVLLGAVVLSDFLSRVAFGVVTTFFEDVWSRNFLNLFASPLSSHEYILGLLLSGCLSSLLGLVAMSAVANLWFDLSPWSYGAALLPCLVILLLSGMALGLLGIGIVLRYGPASEWLVWPIPALITPFAGVFYPIASLPGWMQNVAWALPPSYVFEGLRAVLRDGQADMTELLVGFALSLGYVALAMAWFTRVFRRALQSGLLARYSAENAG